MVLSSLFAIALPTGVILNAAELVILIREKKIKYPFKMILFSLAIADLLTLTGASIFAFAWIVYRTDLGYALDALYTGAIVSQFHVIIITSQRIVAVAFPLQYKALITSARCAVLLVFVWVLTASISAVLLIFKKDIAINIFTYLLLACGIFLILSYNFIICRVLKDRRRVISSRAASLRNKKLIIYSLSVAIALIVCNYPFAIRIIATDGRNVQSTDKSLESFLFFLNPTIDPVIYLLLHGCKYPSNTCCFKLMNRVEERPVHLSVNVDENNESRVEAQFTKSRTARSHISSTMGSRA